MERPASVLNQFLDHRGRAFHHLTGGNLGSQARAKFLNFSHEELVHCGQADKSGGGNTEFLPDFDLVGSQPVMLSNRRHPHAIALGNFT